MLTFSLLEVPTEDEIQDRRVSVRDEPSIHARDCEARQGAQREGFLRQTSEELG